MQEPIINTERRQFSRVAFNAEAELITTEQQLQAQVLDLSLKGALLRLPDGAKSDCGAPCLLKVSLGGNGGSGGSGGSGASGGTIIAMAGEITHVEGDLVGVLCRSIDIESITHLRRLIEMNLGDAALLERDLKALISAA